MRMSERYAYHFRLDHNLRNLCLSYMDLLTAADECGYIVKTYYEAKAEIIMFGLLSATEKYDAFTLCNQNKYWIYIKDDLSERKKRFTLAHEIGHIALHHTYSVVGKAREETVSSDVSQNEQEKEADDFALCLLGVPCVFAGLRILEPYKIAKMADLPQTCADQLSHYAAGIDGMERLQRKMCMFCRPDVALPLKINIRRLAVITLVFILISCGSYFVFRGIFVNTPAAAAENSMVYHDSYIVYIASNDGCYHHIGCYHIHGKNVISVTREEAEHIGKEPCIDCQP